MFIYHIVLPEIWRVAADQTEYAPTGLASEGFIHCSYESQLPAVIERYYGDQKRLIILRLDPEKLTSKLVAEPSTGGEIYPHIYGPIDRTAIVEAAEYIKQEA